MIGLRTAYAAVFTPVTTTSAVVVGGAGAGAGDGELLVPDDMTIVIGTFGCSFWPMTLFSRNTCGGFAEARHAHELPAAGTIQRHNSCSE